MKTKHLIYAALFAALIAVGAQIRIPIGPVPVTFQVPMVLLAGFLLGPKLAALSTTVYMLVGLVGVPVFAGAVIRLCHRIYPGSIHRRFRCGG